MVVLDSAQDAENMNKASNGGVCVCEEPHWRSRLLLCTGAHALTLVVFCGTIACVREHGTLNTIQMSVPSILSSNSETVDTCISATANTNVVVDMR